MSEKFIPEMPSKKWACGVEPKVSFKPTQFELKLRELIIDENDATSQAESNRLRAWVREILPNGEPRYNVVYVPEWLLKTWNIRTEWDEDSEAQVKEMPLTSFSDMTCTDYKFRMR